MGKLAYWLFPALVVAFGASGAAAQGVPGFGRMTTQCLPVAVIENMLDRDDMKPFAVQTDVRGDRIVFFAGPGGEKWAVIRYLDFGGAPTACPDVVGKDTLELHPLELKGDPS